MARRSRSGGGVRQSHNRPPPDPSVTRIDGPWRHLEVHANGIRFHVVEAQSDETSAADRPLVILLHGFASFWW